jgi:hypothetical protein
MTEQQQTKENCKLLESLKEDHTKCSGQNIAFCAHAISCRETDGKHTTNTRYPDINVTYTSMNKISLK